MGRMAERSERESPDGAVVPRAVVRARRHAARSLLVAVVSLAAFAAAPVWAQGHKGGGGGHRAGPPAQFQPPPNARREMVRERIRDERPPGGGRPLTAEERQQLRRDIRDAGRDVYGPGK